LKDDGKLEDAARDYNLALMRSVMALMTSSSTHCLLLSGTKKVHKKEWSYMPAGNDQLSLIFEPACAQVHVAVPTTTAHLCNDLCCLHMW